MVEPAPSSGPAYCLPIQRRALAHRFAASLVGFVWAMLACLRRVHQMDPNSKPHSNPDRSSIVGRFRVGHDCDLASATVASLHHRRGQVGVGNSIDTYGFILQDDRTTAAYSTHQNPHTHTHTRARTHAHPQSHPHPRPQPRPHACP